ncbi:hypothetical protein J437_LFUL003730 [Ladona fulva]|uniref:Uncharacterized protein n=1 Tax=Ladona fulva TaxID=123851 RepID=A0A8K0NW43_LADFU|nr:hypothetical protein J437_LFUL003730 [Ladona fulva]
MGKKDRIIKCVVVGQEDVGKTCLLVTYVNGEYPAQNVPKVANNYNKTETVDGKAYEIELLDTAGPAEFDRFRPLSYPQCDVFLVCFSVGSIDSFEVVSKKWVPEVRTHCPGVPVILVGTQADLRDDQGDDDDEDSFVTEKEATNMVKALDLYAYYEVSAINQTGVKGLFELAIKAAVESRAMNKPRKSRCSLL